MAGIDKTYVTYEQYKQVKSFFTKEMKTRQKQDLGCYFGYAEYTKKDFNGVDGLPIWNTPTLVDLWLANNCKLDFVQQRLLEQYGESWIGWHELDFNEKGFIVSIRHNKSYVAPFKKIDSENIEVYDEFLLYGGSYFHKFFYSAMALIRGEYYNVLIRDSQEFTVEFEIFGLHMLAKASTGEIKYFLIKEDGEHEIGYGYFPLPTVLFKGEKDEFYMFFQEYKIHHSYRKSDFLKYKPEQIIMSLDNECFSVDMYDGFNLDYYQRYFWFLPKYIDIK